MKYRYHLLKYAGIRTRLTCPSCGRKHCFAPYVDEENRPADPEKYGRCDHESSCGYCLYPPSEPDWKEPRKFVRHNSTPRRTRTTITPKQDALPICTIPMTLVRRTVRLRPQSDFITFLLTLFDIETVRQLVDEYYIGVTRSADTIFYQIDSKGQCRTGKVMKYDPATGHRIKDPEAKTPITWIHSILKQQNLLPKEWELTQCLFGEHLLNKYPDKPVALVEAEKTAIICSALMPQCVWVAVGGKTQLGDKVEILQGRTVIAFPDTDGYEKWVQKCAERPHLNIQVSDYLQRTATEQDKAMGADIADILIRWKQNNAPNSKASDPEPPLLKELRKYISPEYLDNVMGLVEDLELHLTGILKMPDDT